MGLGGVRYGGVRWSAGQGDALFDSRATPISSTFRIKSTQTEKAARTGG
jgi:hypothetical protein